jgi:Cu/Ag efflux pump CusA
MPIPDIGEKQVIVFADWPGRSPQDVDNQVTYPLTTSLTGTPGVKTIRSMSGFGFAMVFVIFKDNVDYYWARSRVIRADERRAAALAHGGGAGHRPRRHRAGPGLLVHR